MNKEFKASHFNNIDELLEHCNMWIRNDDYDAYCRWFDMSAMEEIVNYIDIYKQALIDIREYCNSEISEIQNHQYAVGTKRLKKVLQIIDKVLGE